MQLAKLCCYYSCYEGIMMHSFFAISLILCSLLGTDAFSSSEEQFAAWRWEENRKYASEYEISSRFKVFVTNYDLIETLNKENVQHGTVFKANKFADMPAEEFAASHLIPKRTPVTFPPSNLYSPSSSSPVSQTPTSFDWNDKGVVTVVRDQGSAGTCWAFSAVQNIESQWARTGKNLIELSVEQVVDCDGTQDVARGKADCGVFGGWPYLAYQYIQNVGGIQLENDYPYCCGLGGDKGTCYICAAPGYNKTLCGPTVEYCNKNDSCHAKIDRSQFVPDLKVKGWKWFSNNETAIAQHLMDVGPLSVAMNAASLQFYHSGVYDPLVCDPTTLDHAVLLTGFGETKKIFGQTKKYWIVKNSWGKDWGENGYFRIARGKNKCGISSQVTTSVL